METHHLQRIFHDFPPTFDYQTVQRGKKPLRALPRSHPLAMLDTSHDIHDQHPVEAGGSVDLGFQLSN